MNIQYGGCDQKEITLYSTIMCYFYIENQQSINTIGLSVFKSLNNDLQNLMFNVTKRFQIFAYLNEWPCLWDIQTRVNVFGGKHHR